MRSIDCSLTSYFAICRADEFWSRNFSGQTIAQFFIRMLKTNVGMTYNRRITDTTRTNSMHALSGCKPVCDTLETFTRIKASSEQHKASLNQSSQRQERH